MRALLGGANFEKLTAAERVHQLMQDGFRQGLKIVEGRVACVKTVPVHHVEGSVVERRTYGGTPALVVDVDVGLVAEVGNVAIGQCSLVTCS